MFKMRKITIVLYLVISLISAVKLTSKTTVSDNFNGVTEKDDHTVTTRNVNEEKSVLNLNELLNESKLMLDHSNYSSKDSFVTIRYYKMPKRNKESSKNINDSTLKIIKIHTTPSYEIEKLETDRSSRGVQEVVGNKHHENKVSKSSANVNEITKFEIIEENLEKDTTADSNVRSTVDNVMNEFQYIRKNNVPFEKDETTKIHSIVEDAEKEVRADANVRMSLEDLKRELKRDHRNNEPVEKLEEVPKVQNIEEISEDEVPSDSSVRSSIDNIANEFDNGRRNNKPIENFEHSTKINESLDQKVTVEPRGKSSFGNDESENEFESTRKENDSVNKSDKITEDENITENIEKEAEASFRSSNDDNGHEKHLNSINNDYESIDYFKENEYPYQKLNDKLNIVNKLAKPQEKNVEPVAAPKTPTIHTPVANDNDDKDKMDTKGLMRLLQTKMHQNPEVFHAQANRVGLNALLGHQTDILDRYGLLPDKMENINPQENYQETITQLKSSKITDDFSLRKLSLINPYMPLKLEKIIHGNIGRKGNPTPKLIQPLINLRNVVNLNKQNLFKRQFSTFRPNIVALPIGRYG